MKIGSLFSGVGGLELGLERAGVGRVAWQVEQDPFCRGILARHWPTADRTIDDVRAANATNLGHVDLICGGFPCQDVSAAGKGAGLEGARSGLWYEYARIVGEMRPSIVVIENVASGAKRWLAPVCDQLADMGYRSRAFALSAFDVGAPHLRRRVFVVAANADGEHLFGPQGQGDQRGAPGRSDLAWHGRAWASSYANGQLVRQQQGRRQRQNGRGTAEPTDDGQARVIADADGVREPQPQGREQTQWRWARHGDGWTVEPPVCGVAARVPHRAHRNKALGNAVVVQCAEAIGRMIVDGYALEDSNDK